jgi:hypothetical protein
VPVFNGTSFLQNLKVIELKKQSSIFCHEQRMQSLILLCLIVSRKIYGIVVNIVDGIPSKRINTNLIQMYNTNRY